MKYFTTLTVLFLVLNISVTAQLNVITYNIRLNIASDGEHAWPNRKENVISLLKFHEADIFCLQEALADQVLDIDYAFPSFHYVGVGRDDGKDQGEYSPVFYNSERFREDNSGHFWLSENPLNPALGWDAACIRICSWVTLVEIGTGKEFMVFNTHFDHVGTEARKNAADLIIRQIGKKSGNRPVILCGDFNLPPESLPIRKLSEYLNDSYTVSEFPPYGSEGTWAGFTYDDKPGARIDYIFVSDEIKVKKYAAFTDSRERKFYSDHLPVFVELEF